MRAVAKDAFWAARDPLRVSPLLLSGTVKRAVLYVITGQSRVGCSSLRSGAGTTLQDRARGRLGGQIQYTPCTAEPVCHLRRPLPSSRRCAASASALNEGTRARVEHRRGFN